jgi:hypothetical protein
VTNNGFSHILIFNYGAEAQQSSTFLTTGLSPWLLAKCFVGIELKQFLKIILNFPQTNSQIISKLVLGSLDLIQASRLIIC